MLIRSQSKKSIVNLDNIIEIGAHDTKIVCAGAYGSVGLMGIYSTEEKAIKVLDMIQSAYNAIETMKIDKQAWKDNHYFEMPLDSEV